MVSGMTRLRVAETFRGPRSSDRLQVRPGVPAGDDAGCQVQFKTDPGFAFKIDPPFPGCLLSSDIGRRAGDGGNWPQASPLRAQASPSRISTPDGLDPVVPTAPGVRAGSIGSTKAAFSQGRCRRRSRPKPGKAVNSVAKTGILSDLNHRRGTLTGRRGTSSAQGDPGTRSGCRDPVPGEHQKLEQDRQGTGQMQRKGGVITMFGKKSTVISTTYRGGHYEST